MGDADPAVCVRGLSRRYRSGSISLCVFEGLDLDVPAGERVSITGESGAGKSTLLHLMAGLDRPSSGTVKILGRDITVLPEPELARFRNRDIGFVWQMNTLLPEFTAEENVMMPLLVRGTPRTEAALVARDRLEEVGLGGRTHHQAGELSGGEQQRVVFARALAGNPSVLFADEPTGNLDERSANVVMDVLETLQRSRKLTLLYVTHNSGFAGRADRILKLEQGVLGTQHRTNIAGPGLAGMEAK